jgi:citrate lyase subunit beta/citryl-CoA lyase
MNPKLAWHQARALLFVPATAPHLLEKACASGAQTLILDLEDAVALRDKASARQAVAGLVKTAHEKGVSVLVRVNHDLLLLADDLRCVVHAGADGFVLPKADGVELWSLIDQALQELDAPHLEALALVEHPSVFATQQVAALAQVPRVKALALGSEDFAATVGAAPQPALLEPVAQQLILAASAYRKAAFAIAASIADMQDMVGWESAALKARAWGASGGLCIHPKQLAVLHRVFSPTPQELDWANTVVQALAQQASPGVFRLGHQMVDAPVVQRARRILEQQSSH